MSDRMSLAGDLAIIDETEVTATQGGASGNELVLWDVSNPAAPKEVQKFSGVVKWLEDERNFIYVLNSDGLWIVSEPTDRQAEEEWRRNMALINVRAGKTEREGCAGTVKNCSHPFSNPKSEVEPW